MTFWPVDFQGFSALLPCGNRQDNARRITVHCLSRSIQIPSAQRRCDPKAKGGRKAQGLCSAWVNFFDVQIDCKIWNRQRRSSAVPFSHGLSGFSCIGRLWSKHRPALNTSMVFGLVLFIVVVAFGANIFVTFAEPRI